MTETASKIPPDQTSAMRSLKNAIYEMFAVGLGIDAITHVLNENFPGLVDEFQGHSRGSTWSVKGDPFRKHRPEDSIVSGG
jgi:hypothetical protein